MRNVIMVLVILTGFVSPAFGDNSACPPWSCCCEKKQSRVVKKRAVRRVKARTKILLVDFELQCYRRGGEWHNGLCYGKNEPATVIIPSPEKSSVTVKQEQSVVVKNTMPPAAPKPISPPSEPVKQKAQWWWIGLGAWATGLWAGERDFFPGIYGTLIFAINNRFRVGGNIGVGYGPWQEHGKLNVWFGGYFAVRAYKGLFVNFGAETMWGGFDGLSVHRRMFAASAGPEYWFGDRASISLRFLVGVADLIGDCEAKNGQVVGGNILTTTVYF